MGTSYALALGAVFAAACAQLLLKKAADKKKNCTFIYKILNWRVIIAYAILLLSTLMNVFAFRRIDLKYAQLFDASSLIWVTLLAGIFLSERPNRKRLLAIGLVVLGSVVFCL